jgi:hypothetical protein
MATTKRVIVQAKVKGEVVFDETVNGKKHQKPLIRECMVHIDTLGGEAVIRTQVVGARGWAVYRYTAGSNHAEIDTAASWADSLTTEQACKLIQIAAPLTEEEQRDFSAMSDDDLLNALRS